jgi:hypothetical protein
MNNDKDKELDDFIRKGLDDPSDHAVYREADWESLDQMLEKNKKRRGAVYWLPIISSVAALALLFLGWWLFHPVAEHDSKPRTEAALHPKRVKDIKSSAAGSLAKQSPGVKQPATGLLNLAANNNIKNADNGTNLHVAGSGHGIRQTGGNNHRYGNVNSVAGVLPAKAETENNAEPGLFRTNEKLSAVSMKGVFEPHLINSEGVNNHHIAGLAVRSQLGLKTAGSIKNTMRNRPQFALTVLAAPDINGVGSFQQSKIGTNAGLQFSAGLSKFTITTGVIYSAKPYLTNFEDYHTPYKFPVSPVNVTADCRMLDIPLDIGYQVYNKHQNKISIGTGLSSYIMLHENYTFNYAGSNSAYGYTSPTNYTVPHSKSYLMGVFNLNATYERPINSKINIAVEPYLKLPLTNIGYSQVRLQSTGVAVGLKWNLNSLTKP